MAKKVVGGGGPPPVRSGLSFSWRIGRGLTLQADGLPWRDLPRTLLKAWRLRRGMEILRQIPLAPQSRRIGALGDLLTAHQRLLLAEAELPPDALLVASSDGTRSLVWRVRPGGVLACLETAP